MLRPSRLLCLLIAVAAARAADPAPRFEIAGGIQPQIAIGPNQSLHVVAVKAGNIVVASAPGFAKPLGAPVTAIDAHGKAHAGMQRGPRIAVADDGTISVTAFVTFDQAELAKKYPTYDLFLTQSRDGGASWSHLVQMNDAAKKAPEGLHAIAADPRGTVHIAWLDLRARKTPGQDIFYTRVVRGVAEPNRKVADNVCECCAPAISLDAAGNPLIAYREGGSKPSRELFLMRSSDGGKSFATAKRMNKAPTLEDT